LKDGSNEVRIQAAKALGEIGPEAKPAIPALIQLLDNQYSYVRSSAAEALEAIGPASS